eukprot:101934_1
MAAVGRSTRLTPSDVEKGKRFFMADRKVLRFFALWDDRQNLYGDYRLFVIYFFIADSTVQICEVNPPNSGRDPFPSFAARRRVEKHGQPNVSLAFNASDKNAEYFEVEDFKVGNSVVMYGNPFLLYDCDPFTREFMKANFGYESTSIDITQPAQPKPVVVPPTHNGFGDEADALGSWLSLVPKPPRKDMAKFHASGSDMLKFELKMAAGTKADAVRHFVLSYHLADDTISIFETMKRNSGMTGGKFLQRSKVKKPDGTFFRPNDFCIGAEVIVNRHRFTVTGSDERSIIYMEEHSAQFPQANIDTIVDKLRAMIGSSDSLQEAFQAADFDQSGLLDYREFASIVGRSGLDITEHEVMTIMRFFDQNGDGAISWSEFQRRLTEGIDPSVVSPDKSWQQNLQSMKAAGADSTSQAKKAVLGDIEYVDQVAAAAAQTLLTRYNQRRQLFRDTIRKQGENSPDGHIGEQEFRKACDKMAIPFSENDYRALTLKIFPQERRRIPLIEFARMMEGCSSVLNIESINTPLTTGTASLSLGPAHGGVR